jgi:ADP-ribose pyrophosphatase YjhB (NUDIX family)
MKKSSEIVFNIKRFVGGFRKDKTTWYWTTHALQASSPIPDLKLTTVCAFLRVKDDPKKLVIIKNDRGYDVPGGHIEHNESPVVALHREIKEEASAILDNPMPCWILSSDYNPQQTTGILFFKSYCTLKDFEANQEISERKLLLPEEFLKCYHGNKQLIEHLLGNAELPSLKPPLKL